MNRRNFTSALLASSGLLATASLGACQGDSAHSLIGMQLPVVKGLFTDGSVFDLSLTPQPAIIKFWGMWCGPCMTDMPNWLSVVRQLRTGEHALPDVNILTIHVGVPPSNGPSLRQWVAEQQTEVGTPVVDDATNTIMKATRITGTPSTLYVDRDGRIGEHAWEFKNERGVDSFIRKVTHLHTKDKAI
jgi:thiol-disulfide isomerase/thioredoxin